MVWVKLDENKEIVETKSSCPRNTDITSNFYLMSEEEKKTQGWYQVKKDATIVNEWQIVTNKTNTYNADLDEVEEVNTLKDKPLAEFKVEKYGQIKEIGTAFILNEYSLPQQTSALAGFYSVEENEAIKAFTKKYFDIIRLAGTAIQAATTRKKVSDVYFRKGVFVDDEMEPSSYVYWGE